jgi:AraC-like DNA-binding protein
MKEKLRLRSIDELHQLLGFKAPRHPLITFIDFSKDIPTIPSPYKIIFGFYCIVYKGEKQNHCEWKYGQNSYNTQKGELVFLAPEQALEVESSSEIKERNGWGLFFHPDILLSTHLNLDSPNYSFFSYNTNEALAIHKKEHQQMRLILNNINEEIHLLNDKHSKSIIITNLQLILNYCVRYYERQYKQNHPQNNDIVTRFEQLVKDYIYSNQLSTRGIPSVSYCAEKMNLSSNYLSDILKKETHKSTLEHIHFYLIEKAKQLLTNTNKHIRQIAFELGFEYPQHFNKLFKKHTGINPKAFRQQTL